jgi:5-methylthioadenosine/S-adenosylhomocysteine deaminase
MLAAGVRVGLGTDGAASNNDLDMWEEMRLAAFLQKVEQMNPEVLSAETVLRMATSGGATAIGLGDKVGSLEVGSKTFTTCRPTTSFPTSSMSPMNRTWPRSSSTARS